jgi:hypothetical protein
MFKNDQEQRYFKIFCNQTANQLTGLYSSELWKRLVLQTSESYPSIRHAVIAIGALDPKTWRSPAKSIEETARRQFAYHEYSMAIAEMRDTMSKKSLELRIRLIACLVVFCFESYHFNRDSANSQIRAMSSMIEEEEEKSPDGLDVEEELLETVSELKIQSLAAYGYGKAPSEQLLLSSRNWRQSMRPNIPLEFTNMNHARSVLYLFATRQLHWAGASMYGWPWYLDPRAKVTGLVIDPPPNDATPNDEWCKERNRRFLEYTAWSNAFQPLLLKGRASKDPGEVRRANLLRLTYLYAYLTMMAAMLNPHEAYYGQTGRLAELLALIRTLLEDPGNDAGFSIEAKTITPLAVVAYRFRHRALRKEAIRLLLKYPRREGLNDGAYIAGFSNWLAELEEEGLSDEEEYVPYELAATLVAQKWDALKRTANLAAVMRDRTSLDKTMLRFETTIHW